MLERPSLFLESWRAESRTGQPRRVIRDLATNESLGFAAWRTKPPAGWLERCRPAWLDVFETEDVSHVCALERPWLWRRGWRVQDAEERLIGRVWGGWLHDDAGEMLGYFQGGRLLTLAGLELGNFEHGEAGWEVRFQPALDGNPFARMLLLAAALTAGELA